MASTLDRMALLERLERVKYEKEEGREQGQMEQMSFAASLLLLAEINHEREYALCRDVAEHLLGEAPEPDDADIEEE